MKIMVAFLYIAVGIGTAIGLGNRMLRECGSINTVRVILAGITWPSILAVHIMDPVFDYCAKPSSPKEQGK